MRTMKGLTIERIEQVTGGVLHMSVLTKAGIFASFERETLPAGGSGRCCSGKCRML